MLFLFGFSGVEMLKGFSTTQVKSLNFLNHRLSIFFKYNFGLNLKTIFSQMVRFKHQRFFFSPDLKVTSEKVAIEKYSILS